jgi:hypothetical protein
VSSAHQHRQQVIVESPSGQHEIDILMDVPASAVLPDLLATAGLHPSQVRVGSAGWRLEDAGGNAVPPGGIAVVLVADWRRLGLAPPWAQ